MACLNLSSRSHLLSVKNETARLFFALWPEDTQRQQLKNLVEQARLPGPRPVPPENIHMTLVFPGSMPVDSIPCLSSKAAVIKVDRFDLILDTVGVWSRPRILWVAPSKMPVQLISLVDALNTGLAGCGVEPDKREYKPHITLSRKVTKKKLPLDFEPIRWSVSTFSLVKSRTDPKGPVYEVLESWSLI